MSLNIKTLLEAPIIELDIIDSTNNYAMNMIDADMAQAGMTIVAKSQVSGKGQRGKSWVDSFGQSLLMSIISTPLRPLSEQFVFNASVAIAIADVLAETDTNCDIHIKWPNDIIINDKKAGGVLIENVLRGPQWTYSIIGLGLNVKQDWFPPHLPFATSLKIASGKDIEIAILRNALREKILEYASYLSPVKAVMERYNEYLYKKGKAQSFSDKEREWEATILQANTDGTLQVQTKDGKMVSYTHGEVLWNWR